MKRKSEEIDNITKPGDQINHLTDDSIYAELVLPADLSEGGPNEVSKNSRFVIYVGGEKREGFYSRDQVKMMFKVDDLEMGTDETNMG